MLEDLNTQTTGETQGQADVQPTEESQQNNNVAPNAAESPKVFTQEELNDIIDKRLKREREKAKATQKTDAERIADLEKRLTASERKNALVAANCNPAFTKFVTYEVGKMEGDFVENLKEFKIENPQYFSSGVKLSSSPSMSGSSEKKNPNDVINNGFRSLFGGKK